MNQRPSPPPTLVHRPGQLSRMTAQLSQQPRLAVDTESDSLYAYPEKVCLIQFSIPGADFLVDPLALNELDTLGPIFAHPGIQKVIHGAEYDLACLKRDFGFRVKNLFDTRIAARTLGFRRNGLRHLLEDMLNVQVSKRYQRANWGKRPLPAEMLDYARMDTFYLLHLQERLSKSLEQAGRLEEALEACRYLASLETHTNSFDPQGFWRINHLQELRPQQLAILRELYVLRERTARRLNRPPFKVMVDGTLLAIARSMPKNLEALSTLRGMTPRQVTRYGKEILDAVRRGRRAKRPTRPKSNRADQATVARYERLRHWRTRIARKRHLESDLILPREILWEIARHAPWDRKALRHLMGPLRWRFQTYGDQVLGIVNHSGEDSRRIQ